MKAHITVRRRMALNLNCIFLSLGVWFGLFILQRFSEVTFATNMLLPEEVKSRFVHSLHATLDMPSMWFCLIKLSSSSLLCAPSELTQFSS